MNKGFHKLVDHRNINHNMNGIVYKETIFIVNDLTRHNELLRMPIDFNPTRFISMCTNSQVLHVNTQLTGRTYFLRSFLVKLVRKPRMCISILDRL